MKLAVALSLALPSMLLAQSGTQPARHESLKQEIRLAYDRGLAFLKGKQNTETGQWGDAEPVAFTALAIISQLLTPGRQPTDAPSPEVEKGYAFLLKNVQPDGGIYVKARANYNTSLALTALMLSPKPQDEKILLAARRFIIGQQNDFDEKGKADNAFDGGIGYGTPKPDKPAHADLSNTHFALEALYYSQALLADKGDAGKDEPQLNFAAAIQFIQNCQNRPETNKASWVSTDKADAGGFVYSPGETRGKEEKTPDGRTALRSYGSISYAGMLSFIYAGLDKDDPRVKAVMQWLSENYTLEENPGVGPEGLYYYYHTMAKALAIADVDFLKTKDGQTVDWRADLAKKLLNLQQGDGSWANSAGRWMESDTTLATSYMLMALARVHESM
ncbi:squalene-hopene/tetraprenyl-beta-curcumene cyclase [Prosthecobacter fusiformis]|uniref:Squalene-hopene/tetraprenyl-beta-curcumene cyclase n=1 Tax=Prosthecobacter fusiformis TaxID=48464 RepID=A0A4R7SRL6_9BACT|nr:prenyltransferase/squalene oxidase repeat-containing protein [Prosthecobacter fusiformis]TDU81335.1 squalene-hopene/tetraprenyl-beta-curcumene cyclase [Prosthecobacter fusiformis]